MTHPTTEQDKDAVYATTGTIAKALNEPKVKLVSRIVWTLGIEQAQAFLQQALDIEAQGGMMTLDGQKRRTPGGVFFRLVREHIAATDKKLYSRIFGPDQRKSKPVKQSQQPAQKPAPPPVEPLVWAQALQYANALLKHEKGETRSVEVKLIGRPTKIAKANACMVVMMVGKGAPKSLPKGLPAPPDEVPHFAVFIGNKQWAKVSDELKRNANAELLVKGHPVFNPEKATTLLLAQSVEMIERKPRKAQAQAVSPLQ